MKTFVSEISVTSLCFRLSHLNIFEKKLVKYGRLYVWRGSFRNEERNNINHWEVLE